MIVHVSSREVTDANLLLQQQQQLHPLLCFAEAMDASSFTFLTNDLKILTLICPLFGGTLAILLFVDEDDVSLCCPSIALFFLLLRSKLKMWLQGREGERKDEESN
ncbi:hypothetical protein NL676_003998 [Syzygium grande]|nr:hypothetical protein NL676_003998 [Syzygium grande]